MKSKNDWDYKKKKILNKLEIWRLQEKIEPIETHFE